MSPPQLPRSKRSAGKSSPTSWRGCHPTTRLARAAGSGLAALGLASIGALSANGAWGSPTAGAATTAASATTSPAPQTLPQKAAAQHAAAWLAGQVNAKGFIVNPSTGKADLGDTALTVLALSSTGTQTATAQRALTYLSGHVHAYVKVGTTDAPGPLATLILDAKALGQDPTSFAGTNLVQRLLATMRPNGLFGDQLPTYDGVYRQGLSLAALANAGVTGSQVRPAVRWLKNQQCADGGWMSYRKTASIPCPADDPSTFSGPDTNSTALAVEGLTAQGDAPVNDPTSFLQGLETVKAGWGEYGPPTDPDSTALVIQGLIALKAPVSVAPWVKSGNRDPVSALRSFQLADGAFTYPGTSGRPNLLSTEQAIPALMRKALPF